MLCWSTRQPFLNTHEVTCTSSICCVPGCKNNSKTSRNISFHSFPKNLRKKNEWIYRINRKWKPKNFHKVCGIHFNVNGIKTSRDKFPEYFPDGRVLDDEIFISERKKIKGDTDVKYINIQDDLDLGMETTISNIVTETQSVPTKNKFLLNKTENTDDHTYCMKGKVMALFKEYQYDKDCLLNKMDYLESEVKRLTEENGKFGTQMVELKFNIRSLEYNLNKQKSIILDVNNIINNDRKLQFYTGFSSVERFKIFAEFIEPGYNLARYISRNSLECRRGRRYKLTFTEQLFLVLCRLRLGLLEQDLSHRFNISVGTVSHLWSFWVDLLSSQLCKLSIWPSRTLVDKYMPQSFKNLYPNTRVILYCTELYIETPSDFRVQSATFSNYKSHNTAKGLIGIAPNGMISFVSDLYPGRVSDKQITFDSGILSCLQEGDSIMADRGFTIEEYLRNINVTLNIPPFLKGVPQIAKNDVEKTSNIASLRIHVERSIRHVKTFRILKNVFPNSMHDKVNQIWKICCYLTNFIGEPLLEK